MSVMRVLLLVISLTQPSTSCMQFVVCFDFCCASLSFSIPLNLPYAACNMGMIFAYIC